MKYAKLFLVLSIIMAVAIAPVSGAFAQTDAENSDIQTDKEQRKAYAKEIKEQRQLLKDQLKDLNDQRKNRLGDTFDERIQDVEFTLSVNGVTSGWAVVDGKAFPAEFILDANAGYAEKRGMIITGTGTIFIGDREITLDLKGFAKNNRVHMNGVSQDDDSIKIHLKGHFVPIADSDDSYALAFTRAAIIAESSDVKVPLVLVGDVTVTPTITDEPVIDETDSEDVDIDVLDLLT